MKLTILTLGLGLSGSLMATEWNRHDRIVVEGANAFSQKLGKELKTEKKPNVVYSSYNIWAALSLLQPAAREATLKELEAVMGTNGALGKNFLTSAANVNNLISSEGGVVGAGHREKTITTLKVAYSLWANSTYGGSGFSFQPDYLRAVNKDLKAYAVARDFKNAKTLEELNGWVKTKTDKLIPTLLKELPSDVMSVLISTLIVKGKWAKQFEKHLTSQADFTGESGAKQKVDMMSLSEYLPYTQTKEHQVVALHTQDHMVRFEVYLPKVNHDKTALRPYRHAFLEGDKTVTDAKNFQTKLIALKLPRFKARFNKSLKEELKALMPNAFSNQAKYELGNYPANIGDVIHESFVEVNEGGFKAAAATAIMMRELATSVPASYTDMVVNRSFGFRIVHNRSNLELFRGWISNPEKAEAPK